MSTVTPYTIIVGGYNGPSEKGLSSFDFDPKTLTSQRTGHLEINNPSAFVQVPNSEIIYTVSESPSPNAGVYLVRFSKDAKDNKLSLIRDKMIPIQGADPCSIALVGDAIITADYSSGSITIVPLTDLDKHCDTIIEPRVLTFKLDKIGPNTARQEKSHIHTVRTTPDKRHLIATDLGADKLYIYALDENRNIVNSTPAEYSLYPGCGPRHIEIDAEGRFIYVITELHGTIDVLHISPPTEDGEVSLLSPRHPDVPIELNRFQLMSTGPNGQDGSADIHISHDGNFLYTSHRSVRDDDGNSQDDKPKSQDGITSFRRNKETGQLTQLGFTPTKNHPRHFSISPDDQYVFVACRFDNCIQIFKRNIETGLLDEVKGACIKVEQPSWIEFRV